MAYIDYWMLIPIVVKFIMGTIIASVSKIGSRRSSRVYYNDFDDGDYGGDDEDYVPDNEQYGGGFLLSVTALIIQLIANTIPHYIRTSNFCNDSEMNYFGKDFKINFLGKAFVDGTIENGVGTILPTILKYMPVISIIFRLFGRQARKIVWTISYVVCYLFINMINESSRDLCNIGLLGTQSDTVFFVIFLIISLLYTIF